MDPAALGDLSLGTLHSYARIYHLPTIGVLEKPDLVRLIYNAQPLADRYECAFRTSLPDPSPRPAEAVANDAYWLWRPLTEAELRDIDYLVSQMYGIDPEPAPTGRTSNGVPRAAATSEPRRDRSSTTVPSGPPPPPSPAPSVPARPVEPPPPSIPTIIANQTDIRSFTARQLKAILAANLVDYQHAVEKQDLIDKLEVLLNNTRAELAAYTKSPDEEENNCRVCYDGVINCLILECGHMATCVECAKRLQATVNACPICRQPITRVVHVFKT
ncbi:RING finger protein 34 [Tieghemiomyces parasiticus]|uniref:RING finger protein 34 n=1 Tax=Tieghemiomyces parasiticus TaxID=78921 RepID=A0A9W8ACV5_9FUNG|nr:RING finger protein 34 [Tieghemiomyces parasiticus]